MPFLITPVAFLGVLLLRTSASTSYGTDVFAVSSNCSDDSQPCGPATCCDNGLQCNYRRGIPVCENTAEIVSFGFNWDPCADPYLFKCDEVLGIPGFCCPIGTLCFNDGADSVVSCINELGTTASALPSATTGLIPSSTPVLESNSAIVYNPPDAWVTSNSDSDCTTSTSLRSTDTLNATISFNYTGPSIMVHVVTSSSGGVFWVIVDGFNTSSYVDTYSGPGLNSSRPVCYPNQFPPFVSTPPGYQSDTNHSLTLVYTGNSKSAPEGTTSSVQFDSFAIPDLESSLAATSNDSPIAMHNLNTLLFFMMVTSFFFPYLA